MIATVISHVSDQFNEARALLSELLTVDEQNELAVSLTREIEENSLNRTAYRAPVVNDDMYSKVCRGEETQNSSMLATLTCRYVTENSPFLTSEAALD